MNQIGRYLPALAAAFIFQVAAQAARAPKPPPMSVDQAREFMQRLATYVRNHHLKKDDQSPQRGLIYEYLDVTRIGQPDQFVEGEALDTMHDGAWFASAMVNASRASDDRLFRQILVDYQLPFYCKMLNHSDELFSAKRNDARPSAPAFGKEHMLIEGEKGFVPYFWDDGNSVSLDRRRDHNPLGIAPCRDYLAGKPNPLFVLDGYSLGCSNHMAQDLGVMLQQSWLLLRSSASDKPLVNDVAEAAKNLQASRMRHFGHIPMCDAPAALVSEDPKLLNQIPDPTSEKNWIPDNHYTRILYDFKPGQRMASPNFADDQEFHYYAGMARSGGTLPKPLAFKIIYDAFTERLPYHYYCDDAPVEPGINVFDLYPYYFLDGKPVDYRSDRKGPSKHPKPIGSRMGPQNMVCCGWALQALRTYPGIWEEAYQRKYKADVRVQIDDGPRIKTAIVPYAEVFKDDLQLSVLSSHMALEGIGRCPKKGERIEIFSHPGGTGSRAVIEIGPDNTISAVNDKGEKLSIDGDVSSDTGLTFAFKIPYTVTKGQNTWANGVEHERLSIRAGNRTRNLYLASSEQDVKTALERELGVGLQTWDGIFREKGYIPTGIGTFGQGFDNFSDTGGYAHLISAAAEWILYQQGKNDWELQQVPQVRH